MATTVGEATSTEIRNLTFNDENNVPQLLELQQAYPGADIYLNSELTVNFSEDVKLNLLIERNQMATVTLSKSRIKFGYCNLDKAIAFLKEQYLVGSIEVRIARLKSKL